MVYVHFWCTLSNIVLKAIVWINSYLQSKVKDKRRFSKEGKLNEDVTYDLAKYCCFLVALHYVVTILKDLVRCFTYLFFSKTIVIYFEWNIIFCRFRSLSLFSLLVSKEIKIKKQKWRIFFCGGLSKAFFLHFLSDNEQKIVPQHPNLVF